MEIALPAGMTTKSEQLQVLLAMAETVGRCGSQVAHAEHARFVATRGADARRKQNALRQARQELERAESAFARARALWWEQFTGETEELATASPRSMS